MKTIKQWHRNVLFVMDYRILKDDNVITFEIHFLVKFLKYVDSTNIMTHNHYIIYIYIALESLITFSLLKIP